MDGFAVVGTSSFPWSGGGVETVMMLFKDDLFRAHVWVETDAFGVFSRWLFEVRFGEDFYRR